MITQNQILLFFKEKDCTMNTQIVEISEENSEGVVGGDGSVLAEFGKGLIQPFGFYGNTPEGEKTFGPWSYKDFGNCSLYNKHGASNEFSWISALGIAITDTVIISRIVEAGHFAFDKIKSLIIG